MAEGSERVRGVESGAGGGAGCGHVPVSPQFNLCKCKGEKGSQNNSQRNKPRSKKGWREREREKGSRGQDEDSCAKEAIV